MKNWGKIALWSGIGLLVLTLLILANSTQANRKISVPNIHVYAEDEHVFLTKTELSNLLLTRKLYDPASSNNVLNVSKIESFIANLSEVKHVSVYKELGGQWCIDVQLRRPIARIFNRHDESFYLDSEGEIVRSTHFHSARTVVVSGFIDDRITSMGVTEIINNDSLKSIRKLDDVYRISNYVCNDPLMRSLIGQIHLTKRGDFILIPIVGEQKIVFGSATTEQEVKQKFEKLQVFYKEAIPYEGWNKYEEINLKYDKQLVCRKRKGFTEEN